VLLTIPHLFPVAVSCDRGAGGYWSRDSGQHQHVVGKVPRRHQESPDQRCAGGFGQWPSITSYQANAGICETNACHGHAPRLCEF